MASSCNAQWQPALRATVHKGSDPLPTDRCFSSPTWRPRRERLAHAAVPARPGHDSRRKTRLAALGFKSSKIVARAHHLPMCYLCSCPLEDHVERLSVGGINTYRVQAQFDSTGPLYQVGAGFPVPSGWECEVGNAIGTVHDETPFGSPWRKNGDRLRVTCRERIRNFELTDIMSRLLETELRPAGDAAGLVPRDTKTPLPHSFQKYVRS
jgi:hypothetical protein